MEIEEIIKQYTISFEIDTLRVTVKARIIKHIGANTYSYETSQLFKEPGAMDFYHPGGGALTVDDAERKLFDYMTKFENSVSNGGQTTGNTGYIV
jgi:hypothetical protein